MELYKRDWKVRVAGIEFTGLDIDFTVKKSLRPEPNSCSLTIYGLSASSRHAIEQLNLYDPKKIKGASKTAQLADVKPSALKTGVSRSPKVGHIPVEIEAGYVDQRSLIFRGDLRRGISKYDGPEVSFEIEGEDGGRSMLASRINHSFPAGTRVIDVVQECALALGLGLGNIREVGPLLIGSYSHGTTLQGQASTILTGILRKLGVSYSVQNGVLQFRQAGVTKLTTRGILLSQETGLVGRPVHDATGALMVTCLLIPDVAPGQYMQLKSKEYVGAYYIKGVESTGQSSGNDWYHKLECYPA